MENREQWLADTLVELADTLTTDFDLVDLLAQLTERCVQLLDAAEVGLVVADQRGNLRVMASSTERMRAAELFEIQNEEGPCLECYRTGQAVPPHRLDGEAETRWPVFSALARELGYCSVLALPMRLRDDVIGSLNIFHDHDREIASGDIRLAQALADTATIGILQERAVRHSTELAEQLQGALNTRVVIEQAKGMLAERLTQELHEAFDLLRSYARHHNMQIGDVARDVVQQRLRADALAADPLTSADPGNAKRSRS